MDSLLWWCWIVCWTAAGLPTALTSVGTDQEEEGSVVESEPEFIQSIGNVTVAQGRDAVLSCSIGHLNDYTVGWVKVDTKAIQATGRRVVTLNTRVSVENIPGSSTWKLIIKSAQPVDAGWYMAQINTNPMKSQMTYLSVMEPPNIDDQATPSLRQVRENEPVVLHCQATGQPVPKITWRREDGSNLSHATTPDSYCNANRTNQIQQTDIPQRGYGQLCIASASRSSMGTYYCIASNGVLPSVSKRIQLVVLFPTLVRAERPLVGHSAGALFVNLDCIVEGWPHPNHLIWYKGNSSVDDLKRYSTSLHKINVYTTRMTLTIYYLQETDADFYHCQAGKMKASIQLYVVIPSTTTTTTTTLESSTTIKIETTAKKLRPTRMSSTYSPVPVQSTRSTTELIRMVTLDTPNEIGVLTSSNRPVKDMIYKNITNHQSRSNSIRLHYSIPWSVLISFFFFQQLWLD